MFSRMGSVVAAATIVAVWAGPADAQFGFGGGPAFDRLIPFLDRDRDGYIDEEEFQRIPAQMQEWLIDNGFDPYDPIPVEELIEVAPEMAEDLRRAREEAMEANPEGFGRFGDFRGRGEGMEGRSERGDRDRRGGRPDRSEAEAAPKRVRVTVSLPEKYHEADLDGDGQIGLYEWKLWKPGQLEEFYRLDADGDGFLTPRELVRAETGGAAASSTVSLTRPANTSTERSSTPTSQASGAGSGVPTRGDVGRAPGGGRPAFGGADGRQGGRFQGGGAPGGGGFRGRR